MPRKYTTEEWINKAKAVNGSRYDYSKTKYKDAKTKVVIICKEHGGFLLIFARMLFGFSLTDELR